MLSGRRRWLPHINSTKWEERSSAERVAVNSIMQVWWAVVWWGQEGALCGTQGRRRMHGDDGRSTSQLCGARQPGPSVHRPPNPNPQPPITAFISHSTKFYLIVFLTV